eukprot:m.251361 g.251361  ORF g.251361 m.251361 type:complete len:124 (+) comp15449_c1_seq4:3264-3635(+)
MHVAAIPTNMTAPPIVPACEKANGKPRMPAPINEMNTLANKVRVLNDAAVMPGTVAPPILLDKTCKSPLAAKRLLPLTNVPQASSQLCFYCTQLQSGVRNQLQRPFDAGSDHFAVRSKWGKRL